MKQKNTEAKKENVLKKIVNAIGGDRLVLLGAIILVFIIFTSLNRNFLTWQNIVNLLVAASLVGMVAVGHTYLIIAGQNDLSPGSLAAFAGVLAALLLNQGIPFVLVMVITLAASVVVALFNAWMVNKIHLEAFIATLVTQTIVRGFAFIICDGRPVAISNKAFLAIGKVRFLSLPLTVWMMIVAFVVFGIILDALWHAGGSEEDGVGESGHCRSPGWSHGGAYPYAGTGGST